MPAGSLIFLVEEQSMELCSRSGSFRNLAKVVEEAVAP